MNDLDRKASRRYLQEFERKGGLYLASCRKKETVKVATELAVYIFTVVEPSYSPVDTLSFIEIKSPDDPDFEKPRAGTFWGSTWKSFPPEELRQGLADLWLSVVESGCLIGGWHPIVQIGMGLLAFPRVREIYLGNAEVPFYASTAEIIPPG